jgi:hypothetical protein
MVERIIRPGDRVRAVGSTGPATLQVLEISDQVRTDGGNFADADLVLVTTEHQHLFNIGAASQALQEAQDAARALVEKASAAYGAVARGEYA